MSRSRSRIACIVIPWVLAACRFELPEPEVIDADLPRSCGNGVHEPEHGEDCDTAGSTQACDGDCTAPACGDGYRNPLFVPPGAVKPERCDTAGDTQACDSDCSEPACGDSHVNAAAGELCDDGNRVNKDACPDGDKGTCKPARCGDGHVRLLGPDPEECDNGPANSDTKPDGCRTSCRKAYCGDGVKDKHEECDGSSGCASPNELCWPGCKCMPGLPPPPLHGGPAR